MWGRYNLTRLLIESNRNSLSWLPLWGNHALESWKLLHGKNCLMESPAITNILNPKIGLWVQMIFLFNWVKNIYIYVCFRWFSTGFRWFSTDVAFLYLGGFGFNMLIFRCVYRIQNFPHQQHVSDITSHHRHCANGDSPRYHRDIHNLKKWC